MAGFTDTQVERSEVGWRQIGEQAAQLFEGIGMQPVQVGIHGRIDLQAADCASSSLQIAA